MTVRSVRCRTPRRLLVPGTGPTWLLCVFFILLNAGAYPLLALSMGRVMQNLVDRKALLSADITFMLAAVVGLFVTQMGLTAARSVYLWKVNEGLKDRLHHSLLDSDDMNTGPEGESTNISVFTNDVYSLEQDYYGAILDAVAVAVVFGFSVISMSMISPLITVITLVSAVFMITAPALFGKPLSAAKSAYFTGIQSFTVLLKEQLSALETLKIFAATAGAHERFTRMNHAVERARFKVNVLNGAAQAVGGLSGYAVVLILFAASALSVQAGSMTIAGMIACIQLSNTVMNPLVSSFSVIARIQSADGVWQRVTNMVGVNGGTTSSGNDTPVNAPRVLAVEGASVTLKERTVLEPTDLTVLRGHSYAIIGPSGSGKTTLARLLGLRIRPTTGVVTLDGVDVGRYEPDALRGAVVSLTQESVLFEETLEYNLTLGARFDEEQLWNVIRASRLEETVSRMPLGLRTPVAEAGSNLSGGERRRIALARVLLRNASFVILDEVESGLDENLIGPIMDELLARAEMGIVIVTHRTEPEFLRRFDEVLTVENGKLTRAQFDTRAVRQAAFEVVQRDEHEYSMQ